MCIVLPERPPRQRHWDIIRPTPLGLFPRWGARSRERLGRASSSSEGATTVDQAGGRLNGPRLSPRFARCVPPGLVAAAPNHRHQQHEPTRQPHAASLHARAPRSEGGEKAAEGGVRAGCPSGTNVPTPSVRAQETPHERLPCYDASRRAAMASRAPPRRPRLAPFGWTAAAVRLDARRQCGRLPHRNSRRSSIPRPEVEVYVIWGDCPP